MAPTAIVPGLWQLGLGSVNAFVLDDGGELTLVDTGMPGSEGKIVKAIEGLGRQPADIARIVVTHCHPDHAGSLAALKRIVDAPAIMHRADAEMCAAAKGSVRCRPRQVSVVGCSSICSSRRRPGRSRRRRSRRR